MTHKFINTEWPILCCRDRRYGGRRRQRDDKPDKFKDSLSEGLQAAKDSSGEEE